MKWTARAGALVGWACLAIGYRWWSRNRDRSWPGV